MSRRGDVVIVDVPFTGAPGSKERPAVVVQADAYNNSIRKTVIAIPPTRSQRINSSRVG